MEWFFKFEKLMVLIVTTEEPTPSWEMADVVLCLPVGQVLKGREHVSFSAVAGRIG
jgi:hypothetical protein